MEQTAVPHAGSKTPSRTLSLGTLFRNSGILYGSTIMTMAISVATKAIQARLLTPEGLGLLLTAQTLAALAATAAQLSVPEALVRFISREGRANMPYAAALVRKAVWTASGASLALVIVAYLTRGLISSVYHDPRAGTILTILVGAVPFTAVATVYCSAYRGFGQVWEKVTFVDTIPAIATLIGLAGARLAGFRSPESVACIYLGSSVLSFVLAANHFLRDKDFDVPTHPAPTRELLRFSLPLLASQLVAWPMAMIPLMLGAKTLSGVAYYNIAVALASLSYTLVSAAETAALPVWSNRIGQGQLASLRNDYSSTTALCFLASSVAFALLFFRTADVIRILYGENYVAGAPLVRCIAPFFLLNAATGPNESLLKAFGATKWIFISRLGCGLGVIVGTLAFHASSGLVIALASYWISSATGLFMYAGYLAVVYKVHPVNRPYLLAAISIGASFLLVGWIARWVTLPWSVVNLMTTGVIYCGALLAVLYLTGAWRLLKPRLSQGLSA